jgi:23S rRNA pseudouridine2605 synthase
MSQERLQKALASAGVGSRRACEDLIRAGRITVNGRAANVGTKVDPETDVIRVDGERLRSAERAVYVALHKPVGVLSSLRSQGGRRTVRDLVDLPERIYPVGRLDAESEGLVLLTNDGVTAHRLTHPRFGHEREYRVLLSREPDREQIVAWRAGVVLPDGVKARPSEVWVQRAEPGGVWVGVIMREGRKRQIRETAQALGLRVRRLVRVRIDGVRIGSLSPGEWRRLTEAEVRGLRGEEAGIPRRRSEEQVATAGIGAASQTRAKRRPDGKR